MPQRQGSGRDGRTNATACALALALACALGAPAVRAQVPPVRIVGVEPARLDSALVCTLVTSGLPDGPTRETLASGLPSSLTLSFTLLDAGGRERASVLAEVRIEPDPWERTFVVHLRSQRTSVSGLDALADRLRRIGPVPIAPLRALNPHGPLRVRARLAVHPLATAEADRARALFVGDMSPNGADRREVSAGLGSLLRFFLGRSPASPWRAQAVSAPFEPATLERLP